MGSRLYRIVSGKFLVLCLIVLGLGGCQQKPSKRPFNVLFVVVDDLRPELGCYGASHISSPNIDELASRSLIFDRAYCQAPICSPSRMSFLSGLRPHETGINDNNTPIREKLPDVITLPQHFKNQGYQTESYGKIFHQRIGDTVSWDYFQDGPRH
ncbi:MAG: sulfatase-like hydrolase/transferase, partial [Cyclobacteriaceae bacterium]|nr:sulfatase-like hydrolase/transferase [Cyclobacteriaceae bacterium HetDA_MAG_MS6]